MPTPWKNVKTRWKVLIACLLVVLGVAYAVAFMIDEPLRRQVERQMNERMKGYTAKIGSLDFHPIGFSLDLRDVVIIQDAHPEPPVFKVKQLSASVQWSAIIHARVVADFELTEPEIVLDRTHIAKELEDPTPVKDRGWQEALQAIYPLKINEFVIRKGAFTYVDEGQSRPLTLRNIEATVNNIRNVKSKPDEFPSPMHIEATVFDTGRLTIDGHSDFLREPVAAIKGRIAAERIGLDYFKPVAQRYGFALAQGTLSAHGDVEYTPERVFAELQDLTVDGLKGDYTYTPKTAEPVKQAAKVTAEAAQETVNKPDTLLRARRVSINGAELGFVNAAQNPKYRVFMSDTNLVLENFSNQRTEGTATAQLTGRFMGSGATSARATFRPETNGPDFDLDARIENTDMKRMNDLLRAHARFDVASGVFSVFTELRVKNARVAGYVKPLFKDLDVYDPEQDVEKSFGQKVKEKVVDLAGKVLRNRPRKEVATVAPIEGPLENPKASTWEALVGLVRNAFIRAILPGFEQERARVAKR